jgi:hypothetical protein
LTSPELIPDRKVLNLRFIRKWTFLPYLLISFVLVLVYLPGVLSISTWSDDYSVLISNSETTKIDTFKFIVSDGRPLYAALTFVSSTFTSNESSLVLLRLLGLVGLVLAANLSLWVLNTRKINLLWIAAGATLIGFLQPTFQMYVHWASTWPYVFSICAGLFAWILARKRGKLRFFIAILLLVFSFSIYQISAFFFFAPLAVSAVLIETRWGHLLRDLFRGLVLVVVAGILYRLLAQLFLSFLDLAANDKVSVPGLLELPSQILWFVNRHLVLATQPFLVVRPNAVTLVLVALPILLSIGFWIWLQARRLQESPWVRITVIGLVVAVSGSPLLLAGKFVEHRYLSGLAWGVAALFVVSLSGWISCIPKKNLRSPALITVLLGLTLLGGLVINHRYAYLIKVPYDLRAEWVKESLAKCTPEQLDLGILVRETTQPWPKRDMIGSFSEVSDLAQPWVLRGAVTLELQKQVMGSLPIFWLREESSGEAVGCEIRISEFQDLLIVDSGLRNAF